MNQKELAQYFIGLLDFIPLFEFNDFDICCVLQYSDRPLALAELKGLVPVETSYEASKVLHLVALDKRLGRSPRERLKKYLLHLSTLTQNHFTIQNGRENISREIVKVEVANALLR